VTGPDRSAARGPGGIGVEIVELAWCRHEREKPGGGRLRARAPQHGVRSPPLKKLRAWGER